MRSAGSNLERYFRHSLLPKEAVKKAVLPGPFTFAVMSHNAAYGSFSDLVNSIAVALKDVVSELGRVGYSVFQFNEPALVFRGSTKEELKIAQSAFETCARGANGKTVVQTYFGDAGPIMADLLEFPVDCIGLDFYSTSIDSVARYDFDKELGCGCVDGRNSLLESTEEIRNLIGRVSDQVSPKGLSIGPNCDLDFLPHPVAVRKARLLSEAKKAVA